MKINLLRSTLLTAISLIALMATIGSCKKELLVGQSAQNELQHWFTANHNVSDSNPFKEMLPDWNNVMSKEDGEQIVYELPLSNPKQVFQAAKRIQENEAYDALTNNMIRLLIFKDKQSGKIQYGTYMSVVNEGNSFDLSYIHYKEARNLTGKIFYFDLTGAFVMGWGYASGEIKRRATAGNPYNLDATGIRDGRISINGGRLENAPLPGDCFTEYAPVYGFACVGTGYPTIEYHNGERLMDESHCTAYIKKYESYTYCEEAGGGDGGGGYTPPNGGGGGGGNTPPPPPVDTVNLVTNPCIRSAIEKALGKGVRTKIKDLMNMVFNTGPEVELQLHSFPFTDNSRDGMASSANQAVFTKQLISFNENTMPKHSEQFAVATVYHEILHAYLKFFTFTDAEGYFILLDEHEVMAEDYLTMLTADLRSLYPSLTVKEARALAWGGLEKTTKFKKLTAAEKNEIAQINGQYSYDIGTNTPNSKGNNCSTTPPYEY